MKSIETPCPARQSWTTFRRAAILKPQRSPLSPPVPGAFSLLKLFIVIAIIANLSEMLSPALAQTTFTKITTGAIVNDGGSSYGCTWGDYDNDGFLDLLVTNAGTDTGPQMNFLYHNNRDGTFMRITLGAVANDLGEWNGCAWADYDNDGNLDLIVTRTDENAAQAVLYRNNGDGTFTRMPDNTIGGFVRAGDGGSQGPAWADYDNDGFLDLFVVRYGIDWLYQ